MRLIQFEHRNFEYVSQKSVIVIWPRICSTCRKHVSVLSSFMTYHRVCNYVSTTDATSGTGTAYPSGAHAFITGFKWGSCYSIFNFMCIFCRSLFVLLYFIFWSLCWLFFFNLRILITTLVSSHYCAIIYLCLARLVFFIFIAHHVDLREKKQNSRTYHINFYTRFLLKKMLTSHWFFFLSFRWYRLLW